MNSFTRSLCIVGAILAIVFALAAPSFACDTLGVCQVESVQVYEPAPRVQLRSAIRYEYVDVEPQVIREKFIVKQPVVQVQKIVRVEQPVEQVRIEKVRIKEARQPARFRQRSRSTSVERIRSSNVQSIQAVQTY